MKELERKDFMRLDGIDDGETAESSYGIPSGRNVQWGDD